MSRYDNFSRMIGDPKLVAQEMAREARREIKKISDNKHEEEVDRQIEDEIGSAPKFVGDQRGNTATGVIGKLERADAATRKALLQQCLPSLLEDSDPLFRIKVLKKMPFLPVESHEALPFAEPLLRDDDWQVRYEAAKAIGGLLPPTREMVQAMIFSLEYQPDKHQDAVRFEAAKALEKMGSLAREAIPALTKCLETPHRWIGAWDPFDVNEEIASTLESIKRDLSSEPREY